MRIQNFYSLNRDVHAPLPASPNMVVLGSTNRLHSVANYGGTSDVLVQIQNSQRLAEEQIERLKVEKELEAKALELENEQLQKKVDEALLSAAKLEELERVVLELQKPKPTWFQKWFLPKPE